MKQILIIIGLILSINSVKAQQIFPEAHHNCNVEGMSLENNEVTVEYKNNRAFYSDLFKNVKQKYLDKLKGEIMIQLLVDSDNKSCCISILNKSNISSNKLKLVRNINSMTAWKHLPNADKKVCAIVDLIFAPKKVIIKRLGVGASRSFKILSSYEIVRK